MIPFELPEQHTLDPKRRYLCRHIFSEGRRCGSPALRGQHLCFYHRSSREQPPASVRHTHTTETVFTMPPIDDRAGIQLAVYSIMARIAAADIDPKRAGLLLYALQIASANLPRHAKAAPALLDAQPEPLVEDVSHHTALGLLAPVHEIPEPERSTRKPGALCQTATRTDVGLLPPAHPDTPNLPTDAQSTESSSTPPSRHSGPQVRNPGISHPHTIPETPDCPDLPQHQTIRALGWEYAHTRAPAA